MEELQFWWPEVRFSFGWTEVKEVGIFQEELSSFRKEYAESRQIGDCVIDIDLGKVGIDREIQSETGSQTIFYILQAGIE